jgi:imidazolonepropionase-like amidohydrolase
MQLKKLISLFALLAITTLAFSQTARVVGLRDNTPAVFAFTGARIVTEPGKVIENGTLVIRNGIIEDLGSRINIPADATVIDLGGKTIYPGFIDMYAVWGQNDTIQLQASGTAYWNPQVRSDFSMALAMKASERDVAALRSQGFVAAHLVPAHGIFRGLGAVAALGDGDPSVLVIKPQAAQVVNFMPPRGPSRGYPTSVMGAIAMVRQTLIDAQWYKQAHAAYSSNPQIQQRPENNKGLEALSQAMDSNLPFVVEATNEHFFIKTAEISKEYSLNLWIRGSGFEYRRLDAIAATKVPVIVPLNFPAPPAIDSPEDAMNASLEDLRHWYLAPQNPARLAEAGVTFSLTTDGLRDKSEFLKNIRHAVKNGLGQDAALAALTTTPSNLLGIQAKYGSLAKGKSASFFIADKNIFEDQAGVEQVWIDGKQYFVKPEREEPRGTWAVKGPGIPENATISIRGENNRLSGQIEAGGKSVRMQTVRFDNQRITMIFAADSIGMPGVIRLSANLEGDAWLGLGETADGSYFSWTGNRTAPSLLEERQAEKPKTILDLETRYPSMEYGITTIPEQPRQVLVRNATIWTQGPQGRLDNADLLISQGKVARVGHELVAPSGALVIDGTGKHITPGLIDPHMHSSISGGVNETGDAITSETRISDVFNADEIWTYRLLAGGMTAGTLFHGSANPIGGQNTIIKLRWGSLPSQMIIEDAKPGLKFALGENVKRSPGRYPNTRLGTEQIIKDAFLAAMEYERQWKEFNPRSGQIPPRRDLQLESILEVIKGERLAHVHVYRADEMLMMMRLAEAFDFRVASFEHALEGYKVADELREHGAVPIVWTDWSSFKVEAADGIHHNAALLNRAGVTTTLHSDNTQLSTRMNWEAGKTLAQGVSEEDALNFVTLNPAKVMGIDHRVGSIEPGKDADFVIWSGHPLSGFTHAEQTWVDGRKYFDRSLDLQLREQVQRERAMLIQRILEEPAESRQQTAPTRGRRPMEDEQ